MSPGATLTGHRIDNPAACGQVQAHGDIQKPQLGAAGVDTLRVGVHRPDRRVVNDALLGRALDDRVL